MGRQKTQGNPFDDINQPNANTLAVKRLVKGWNIWKLFIIFTLLAVVVSAGLISQASDSARNAELSVKANNKTIGAGKGKQVALQAVSMFLPTAFPQGVTNISWDTARKVNTLYDKNSGVTTELWLHEFSFLVGKDAKPRSVTQLVSVVNTSATPAGSPALLPASLSSSSKVSVGAPDKYKRLDSTSSVEPAVKAWAKAYVGSDSKAFTVLVADPNSAHGYQSASLGLFDNVGIDYAVLLPDDTDSFTNPKAVSSGKYAIVQATIGFTAPRDKNNTDTGTADNASVSTSTQASMSVLLLVVNPTKGSARVVDWQSVGDIARLKPYSHAIASSLLQSLSSEDADDNTDSSSSTNASTSTNNTTSEQTGE